MSSTGESGTGLKAQPTSSQSHKHDSEEISAQPLRRVLWQDSKNAATAAICGALTMAAVDFFASIWVAPDALRSATLLRYFFLETSLSLILGTLALPLLVLACCAARIGHRSLFPGQSWQGLLGPTPVSTQVGPAASRLWAVAIGSGLYLTASTLLSLKIGALFKEPQLTALVLAFAQLLVGIALLGAGLLLSQALYFLARKTPSRLAPWHPLASIPVAVVLMILLGWPLVHLVFRALPQLAPLVPWRILLSLASFVLGLWFSGLWLRKRAPRWLTSPRRRLIAISTAIASVVVFLPLTLTTLGADPSTKALAISSSPTLARTMNLIRRANDFDHDGFGSLLGENDCDAFDANINPLARDIPDNGIDENCDGRDFKLGRLPSYKAGTRMPVPEAYQGDWNFLLITIDTVRYDHTTMGGYARDTSPQLAKFAKRSANFTFAIAPSAGTMASVPAIITSKFFHSGIALDEDVPRGSPPRLKPSNTLLSEVFKSKGYTTGAILSHEYFNDWGMAQGVDDYDNTVGKKRDPWGVTSVRLTDRAVAWIGKQQNNKWFLWVHYIDPHGRYVSHPGETNYGKSEMDIYDGEIHFTDKYLGQLLDYLARSQNGKKTVIAITSDHGDAFGEHGYINHAQDLHQEIVHVPLIFYVPNIQPRNIAGPVSPIDIFPTFADLIGADIRDLSVEGESLVPQLFYGKDATKRIVFSETNYPKPLRAVISNQYKLILDLKNNVSRFWNLQKDPGEKKNIWMTDRAGYKKMRGYLDEWLERVVYSRDPESNQAIAKLRDHLVRSRPASATPVIDTSIDDGRILIDSYELDVSAAVPGKALEVTVYFRVAKPGALAMRLQLEAWRKDGPKDSRPTKSRLALTAGGMFPTNRWHEGEMVRDRFKIVLPSTWRRQPSPVTVMLGLRERVDSRAQSKRAATLKGTLRSGSKDLLVIGQFTMPAPSVPDPTKRSLVPPLPGALKPTLQP